MEVSNHRKPVAINKMGTHFIWHGCLHVRDNSAPAASFSEGTLFGMGLSDLFGACTQLLKTKHRGKTRPFFVCFDENTKKV